MALAIRKFEGKTNRKGINMGNVRRILQGLLTDDSGQDLIEYALVAALLGLGSVAALTNLSNTLKNALGGVSNALNNSTA
jgi:pilus assembly protein Flp/PilA